MHIWMNTHVLLTVTDSNQRQFHQHWLTDRELTDSDFTILITILTPLFAEKIISITVRTITEFAD
ncbi:hypothetical protein J8138_12415 [Lactiplantibacillus plantarum]|nr:hypothetical protein [Lactiplantibacillus plantarum]OYL13182.1 hypothetical protein AXF33_13440 [Lactiplantibacillus plantarum]